MSFSFQRMFNFAPVLAMSTALIGCAREPQQPRDAMGVVLHQNDQVALFSGDAAHKKMDLVTVDLQHPCDTSGEVWAANNTGGMCLAPKFLYLDLGEALAQMRTGEITVYPNDVWFHESD